MRKRYEKYMIFVTDGHVTWMVTMLRRMARTRPSRMGGTPVLVANEPLRALTDAPFEVPMEEYMLSWTPFDDHAEVAHALT